MSNYKPYGSLDNYKLCSRRTCESGWGVRKIVLAAVFFATCLYFALMVMSALAAPLDDGKRIFSPQNATTTLEEKADVDPCLPLLHQAQQPDHTSANSSENHARSPIVPLSGHGPAANAVMALGLILGTRYALRPRENIQKVEAETLQVLQERETLLQPQADDGSSALSVAAYRSCKKREALSGLPGRLNAMN